ncbi:N-6 DNA methylase [Ruminococcus albus]|uniref:site-specific DNA-methyltransferase (adenine-specific) n=1 Tax=Ruminococcus albus (strain ATCC 27210 / DSM 20455 / JCM 14654 / NCDO 2250 / 7) TaxID=697329 RepID=E6UDB4_RUMA7|nr:N-6 DNA methylase [Ruminococcus albus]ADU22797.1 N-6 DNA methylase [Ruminococcus albus 7 = DSM 20455]
MNRNQLRDYAIQAQAMIDSGAVEDKIRHYFSSRLLSIFPDYPWWVQAHMQGTEEHVHFSTAGSNREGFVDAVVGKTAIEYEKNLMIQSIFEEGYHQVKEYSAALCNIGIPETEVLGVLSDTVRWYGFKVRVIGEQTEGILLGPDDVELERIMFVDLSIETDEEYSRFEQFIAQFMAREESRILNAKTLVMDFGVDSNFYRSFIGAFSEATNTAMAEKPDYAELIKQVWQNFIAYLGVSDYGSFSTETYVSEFYLVTVAKILCANILAGRAIISSDDEIKAILNGEHFSRQNIYNFVDYDYFGWLNRSPYVDIIIPSVREMQNRLKAYDFSRLGDEDIFGRLLAQLANKEHRLMLGQEFTPHWIARDIVKYNINKIGDEVPHIMDMCCGSGVFLIESINAVREKYSISSDKYDAKKDAIIFSAVMGFDIDPLAVMLAKVNWIMTMRDLFPLHSGSITVPIYHADSLFVATPITHKMPTQDEDYYIITLNHQQIRVPAFLFSTMYRKVFDSFISKVYRVAMARAKQAEDTIDAFDAESLINAVEREGEIELGKHRKAELSLTANQMVFQLESLQRHGQNGIWHFIISNSYRPGLTEKQFNCIVSNPPWMAMSKLADNPYKNALHEIAEKYSIQPKGAAHPHMELATIFLVSSIDRYLHDGACWSYVMPASLMSGLNHEPFRKEKFITSDAELEAKVEAIWELPVDMFKNKAVVLSGKKTTQVPETIDGRVYEAMNNYKDCIYTLNRQGNRSAWTNRGSTVDVADVIASDRLSFLQGCDMFPRTALFHQFVPRPNGNWDIRPIDRTGDLWYLVSDSKKNICNDLISEDFDNEFIYDTFISKHLSPFIMAEPAKGLIPGRKVDGVWKPLYAEDLALLNAGTEYVFQQISDAIKQNLVQFLNETINIYGKLYRQNFSMKNYLVLSSASGSNPCAAYLDLRNLNRNRLVIDQTLYWYLAETEDEAIYISGLLNSSALWDAISDFQPEGGFGKRHIHTLPYKIIPSFDSENDVHIKVVDATKNLIHEWQTVCMNDIYRNLIKPNGGTLSSRRKKQQSKIRELTSYEIYATACMELLR